MEESNIDHSDIYNNSISISSNSSSSSSFSSSLCLCSISSSPPIPCSSTTCICEIEKWNIIQVIEYLKNNNELNIDNEDLEIIKRNKIDGKVLIQLTKKELKESGLSTGPVIKISKKIEDIKKYKTSTLPSLSSTFSTNKKTKRCYSSYKNIEEVFSKYRIKASHISRLPTFDIGEAEEVNENDDNFKHCLNEIKLWIEYMGPANEQNEAARCQFISAILMASIRYFKSLLIFPQIEVVGEEETGRVDFAINMMKTNGDEELICITEGKQSDIKTGIGQNILQLDSALQVYVYNLSNLLTIIFLNV